MILRSKWVVDRTLGVQENGVVDAGGSREVRDFGGSILMPGLVNAHCHLDYTDMVGAVPFTAGFASWLSDIRKLKSTWTEKDYARSIQRGLEQSISLGTTLVGNWICDPRLIMTLPPANSRVWWFLELIALSPGQQSLGWAEWVSRISGASPLWKAGLAPHAPYTCCPEVLNEAVTWSSDQNLPWTVHVAESREEWEMFYSGTGQMFESLKNWGRGMQDCGKRSPLEILRPYCLKSRSSILLVHANELADSDFDWIGSLDPQVLSHLSVVHCPRSHAFFGHSPFSFKKFQSLGVNVCLGTDSLASNQDLSMFSEMRNFQKNFPGVHPKKAVEMATVCGARALGVEKSWEDWQDWMAIPCDVSDKAEVWGAITHFTGAPSFVMVDGLPVISEDLKTV